MKLPTAVLQRVTDSVAFHASAEAYLVLDSDLHIRAANHAYERATLHRGPDMLGEYMFDVFPDNPDTPQARGVANLERSFEWVLRREGANRMGLQRYDVLDPATGAFVSRSWLPINSPIRDADGRTVAILHHVEDVSSLIRATRLERWLAAPAAPPPADAELSVVRDVAERLRHDALWRRQRAEAAITSSARAIERVSREGSAPPFRTKRRD